MNIKRVKYKMTKESEWEVGYVIGEYDGDNKTLLDERFDYVPKIIIDGEKFIAYDIETDWGKRLCLSVAI